MSSFVLLNPADDVATLVRPAKAGDALVEGGAALVADVAPGHKIAAKAIAAADPIRKFGQIIGYAVSDIAPGATQLVMRRAVPHRAAPRSNAPRPHRSAHSELILRLIATL